MFDDDKSVVFPGAVVSDCWLAKVVKVWFDETDWLLELSLETTRKLYRVAEERLERLIE